MFLNSNPCQKTQPIVVFLNPKTPNYLKNRSQRFHLLAYGFFPTSKLNLNLVDDAPLRDIVPWKLSVPAVPFDLASLKKDTTNPEIYKHLYLQLISEYPLSEIFSPTVLKQRKKLLRGLYPQNDLKKPFTCWLPDDSSIYTAELRASF